jgi:hypothetical protein
MAWLRSDAGPGQSFFAPSESERRQFHNPTRTASQDAAAVIRPAMPPTLMADQFLRALLRWARRQSHGGALSIPTGAVDPGELRQVLCAIVCAPAPKERAYDGRA